VEIAWGVCYERVSLVFDAAVLSRVGRKTSIGEREEAAPLDSFQKALRGLPSKKLRPFTICPIRCMYCTHPPCTVFARRGLLWLRRIRTDSSVEQAHSQPNDEACQHSYAVSKHVVHIASTARRIDLAKFKYDTQD
jgi:hypothetical protein